MGNNLNQLPEEYRHLPKEMKSVAAVEKVLLDQGYSQQDVRNVLRGKKKVKDIGQIIDRITKLQKEREGQHGTPPPPPPDLNQPMQHDKPISGEEPPEEPVEVFGHMNGPLSKELLESSPESSFEREFRVKPMEISDEEDWVPPLEIGVNELSESEEDEADPVHLAPYIDELFAADEASPT